MFINGKFALLIALCLGSASLQAAEPGLKVCLAGSTVKAIKNYGEAFHNGALLAAAESKDKIHVATYFFDAEPLKSVAIYKAMVADGCHAVIGFDTTNDLIPIAPLVKEAQVPVISLYGEITDKAATGEHIHSLQTSRSKLVDVVGQTVVAKYQLKRVVIVTSVDKLMVKAYREEYERFFKSKGIHVDHVDTLESGLNINEFEKYYAANKAQIDGVVILSRSVLGAKIIDHIYENRAKGSAMPALVGTVHWGSAALPSILRRLKNKDITAYLGRQNSSIDPDPAYQELTARYEKKFNVAPMVISHLTFDMVNFLAAANRVRKDRPLAVAISQQSFKGVTGIKIDPGMTTSHTKAFVLKVTKDGFELVK